MQKKQVQPIKLKGVKLEGMNEADWLDLNELACSTIMLTLAKSVYFNVAEETTSYGVWQKLCGLYEKQSAASQVYWLKKLVDLKMKEGTPMLKMLHGLVRVCCAVKVKRRRRGDTDLVDSLTIVS